MDYESTRIETFFDIQLNIKGKKNGETSTHHCHCSTRGGKVQTINITLTSLVLMFLSTACSDRVVPGLCGSGDSGRGEQVRRWRLWPAGE